MNTTRNFLVVHEFDLGERPEPLHKAGVVQVGHDERTGDMSAQIVVNVNTITANIQIAKDTGAVEAFFPAGAVRSRVGSELSFRLSFEIRNYETHFTTRSGDG